MLLTFIIQGNMGWGKMSDGKREERERADKEIEIYKHKLTDR